MRKIEKTDYAYTAIDKINKNFSDLEKGGGNSDIIDQGYYQGSGTSFVRREFPDAKIGDFVRIEFPNGNWQDLDSLSSSYAKLSVGFTDKNDVNHALFTVNIGQTVQTGYDIYVSPTLVDVFKVLYISIRAKSTSPKIPFTLRRISMDKVKDYYYVEILDTIQKAKDRISSDCVTLAVVTDLHYRSQQNGRGVAPYVFLESAINMAEIHRHVRLDNIICLGDLIDGRTSAAQSLRDADDTMSALARTGVPFFVSLGNHDTNRYYINNETYTGDRILTPGEIYSYFFQPVDERTVPGAENGLNYYRDIERLKTRLIVLRSVTLNGTYMYSSDCATWLENTISSMETGWKAVVFTHVPLVDGHAYNGEAAGGYTGSIITALQSDKVIGLFEGHVHGDNVFTSPNLTIQVGSNKSYNPNPDSASWPEGEMFYTRTGGQASEDLWDLVVVDNTNALLSCIRFGAGIDRYIHTTPVSVAAGGNVTLTPSVITPASWGGRASESSYITIASGVATISSSAPSGTRLLAQCSDSDGNMEIWSILVS